MARAAEVALQEGEVPPGELPPSRASRRKLAFIAAAALLLTGAVGGGAWYLVDAADDTEESESPATDARAKAKARAKANDKATTKEKVKEKVKEKDRKPSVFMNLETLTVNLQSGAGDRYLQTTIVFELSDEKTAEAIKTQMPVIRSKLLLLLSSKQPAELNAPGGKEELAGEIMREARRHFTSTPEQALLNVHFNAFVIQ